MFKKLFFKPMTDNNTSSCFRHRLKHDGNWYCSKNKPKCRNGIFDEYNVVSLHTYHCKPNVHFVQNILMYICILARGIRTIYINVLLYINQGYSEKKILYFCLQNEKFVDILILHFFLHQENLGEVQIGLMYLPTAEKLSLTIIKAQGLKIMDQAKASTSMFTFIFYPSKITPTRSFVGSCQGIAIRSQ